MHSLVIPLSLEFALLQAINDEERETSDAEDTTSGSPHNNAVTETNEVIEEQENLPANSQQAFEAVQRA